MSVTTHNNTPKFTNLPVARSVGAELPGLHKNILLPSRVHSCSDGQPVRHAVAIAVRTWVWSDGERLDCTNKSALMKSKLNLDIKLNLVHLKHTRWNTITQLTHSSHKLALITHTHLWSALTPRGLSPARWAPPRPTCCPLASPPGRPLPPWLFPCRPAVAGARGNRNRPAARPLSL